MQGEETDFETSIFDLIAAFSQVTARLSKQEFYEVLKEELTVEDKIHQILHDLAQQNPLYFSRLFEKARSKVEVVATFLAILELSRLKEILVYQRQSFGEIEISRNQDNIQPRRVPSLQ